MKLSEIVDKITEDKAKKVISEFEPISTSTALAVTTVAGLITSFIMVGALGYLAKAISKELKTCRTVSGISSLQPVVMSSEKLYKYNKCRIEVLKKNINILKAGYQKCGSSKNPEKCKKNITKGITYLNKQIKKAQNSIDKKQKFSLN